MSTANSAYVQMWWQLWVLKEGSRDLNAMADSYVHVENEAQVGTHNLTVTTPLKSGHWTNRNSMLLICSLMESGPV